MAKLTESQREEQREFRRKYDDPEKAAANAIREAKEKAHAVWLHSLGISEIDYHTWVWDAIKRLKLLSHIVHKSTGDPNKAGNVAYLNLVHRILSRDDDDGVSEEIAHLTHTLEEGSGNLKDTLYNIGIDIQDLATAIQRSDL